MRQYIAEMYEMFGTRGWKHLVAEATDAIEQRKEQLTRATSIDEVRYIQGEVAQLRLLESMENLVKLREEAANDEEELETIDKNR
jgi:pyruvate formate-lyase activating enzyme-like uncharacterized protein